MRPNSARLILLVLVFSNLPAASASADQPASPCGTLCGRVADAVDQKPLGYANVVILGTKLGAQTDEQGNFTIDRVPAGAWRVRVLAMGADPVTTAVIVAGTTETSIAVPVRVVSFPRGMSEAKAAAESVGVEVPWGPAVVSCEIHPASPLFHVGDKPSFRVVITNHGDRPIELVQALDGSAEGWRYPVISLRIEGPEGGFNNRPGLRCGNMNTLEPSDFVTVGPKQSFEPFAAGWWPFPLTRPLRRAGRYKATVCYSTMEPDVRRWVGDWWSTCGLPASLSRLFRRVPMVELTATTEFRVIGR
ncbi:MAG TPA: carboxypeptidase-like regulatory domain-containing protein [Candidatus Eisenbacteria bacterium]|nr:carboxypeptidase-like regulatory domain-containing protein [Candidatus Eisenbacteria bacterium]